MSAELTVEFWAPRRCLLEPIREIFDAAKLLDAAVDAHHAGDPGSRGPDKQQLKPNEWATHCLSSTN
jgi:hypothetical protein